MANIIFDFDGTLADTFPLIVDVAYNLSSTTKRLNNQALEERRQLPLLRAVNSLGIPWWRMPPVILLTRHHLTPRMQEVPAFDGVPAMMRALHDAGHRLFVLTSNYRQNVRAFLVHHKLQDYIEDIETVRYANVPIKAWAFRRLAKRHNLTPTNTYVVGNEALDIQAGQRAGMHTVGVLWGGVSRAVLEGAQAGVLIRSPRELPAICAKAAQ
jgi:phosphoglycolate phosphatase